MSFLSSFSLPWVIHHVRIHPAVSTSRSCVRCIHTTSNRRASSDSHTGKVHQHHHHHPSSENNNTIQTFHTKNGKVKIDLSNRSLIGVHQSRGERAYQEDTFAIHSVDVLSDECRRALPSSSSSSSSSSSAGSSLAGGIRASSTAPRGREEGSHSNNTDLPSSSSSTDKAIGGKTEQSLYCAVFDGHNGSQVSTFLSHNLHQRILSTQQHEANDIVSQYRSLGGYMRRYRGGLLSGMVEPPAPRRMKRIERELKVDEERRAREDRGEVEPETTKNQEEPESGQAQQQQEEKKKGITTNKPSKEYPPWNLLQRLEATFLKTDLEIIETEKDAGSTATVALLHSLDEPRNPFFASEELHLILAHCGDTRALLCTVPEGTAVRLTETHHPEARSETDRLMRIRTGAVTDSFGESRWAGSLANTRAFGDAHYKALGVFSEPQLISQTINGSNTAFLILLSDGITEVLSDQEIVDLSSRGGFTNPSHAARNVISFAESVGAQDNLTCLIVPLQGWGKVEGNDSTLKRRELRVANYEGRSNRQNRM